MGRSSLTFDKYFITNYNNGKRDLDMNLFNSLSRSIKNVFVGSHKGEDVKDDWFNAPHPHDSMPIANGSNRYAPPEKLAELESMEINPRPEEEVSNWFNIDKEDGLDYEGPVESVDSVESSEENIHQKMYEIATAKYNPFSVGGSENIHDFDSLGGSENRL